MPVWMRLARNHLQAAFLSIAENYTVNGVNCQQTQHFVIATLKGTSLDATALFAPGIMKYQWALQQ
jgi:hypothetical protein